MNLSTVVAKLGPAGRTRRAKYLAHFLQALRFRLWTVVQQHWLLSVLNKSVNKMV